MLLRELILLGDSMDRGTKLMMALSSMLGALGVAGIVIFALSVGYGRFS